ncbi:MAG: M28 family peptidase [Acholeplasmataceae bacterium]|nr:M28 family peptidase [Acholeplasmataceae bacterium]
MKTKNFKIVSSILLLSLILSMFVLYTPIPVSSGADGFSAAQAAEHIEFISRKPHSVFDADEHEIVRSYIKTQFEEYVGTINVSEFNYSSAEVGDDTPYDIQNVLAVIPGDSATGILLVAHYDSRGHVGRDGELGRSYGAADDGYGIATLLEIARIYGNKQLTNSIYILATDGEETGLYGAMMAATEPFVDHIGFVVNIEARGNEGPAYMFETSTDNEKVIDFYKQANLPVSYSLATAVYAVMPNSTDFTEFLAVDKQGVNFAVLDDLYYYHTPNDNYENINLSSIQHYGSQIQPLVESFVNHIEYSDVDYFIGSQNQVFFTILPNLLIAYRESTMQVLHFVFLILFLGIVAFLVVQKQIKLKSVAKYLGITFGLIAVFAFIGLYLAKLIAFIGHVPFSITYVRMQNTEWITLIILLLTVGVLGYLYQRFVKTEENKKAMMISGISINLLFALLTGFILSGASFLFFIPAALGIISLYVLTFVKSNIWIQIALSQNILWNVLLIVPILYSLYLALTIGGLLAFMVILVINMIVVIPYFFKQIA